MSEDYTNYNKSSVRGYVSLLQDRINCQSARSASCKTWLMSILVGFIAISKTQKIELDYFLLIAPIILFDILDAYFLGLEQFYKDTERDFLKNVLMGNFSDAYNMPEADCCTSLCNCLKKLKSLSVVPYYSAMIILVVALNWIFGK